MKTFAAFLLGLTIGTSAIVLAAQISSTVSISCNSDGTMSITAAKKP